MLNTAASAGGAYAAGTIGDLGWVDGSLDKVLLHAGLGGLMAEVMGSDFRTGAIAGGANEALVGLLGDKLLPANLTPGSPEHVQAQANLIALSKIVGVLGAAATNGDLDVAAQVAENGTRYNYLLHEEIRNRVKELNNCKGERRCEDSVLRRYAELNEARNAGLPELCKSDPAQCVAIMKQLASESGANYALMDSIRHESVNHAVGVLLASQSNDEAISTIQSELTRLEHGDGTAFVLQILQMAAAGNLAKNARVGGVKGSDKALWGSWKDYPKVSEGGKVYAQIGGRLYTEHAVNRMQPSGLGAPAGEKVPGRNVSPNLVDDVIRSGRPVSAVVNGVPRTVYWSGNVGVVTERSGKVVVTILRRASE